MTQTQNTSSLLTVLALFAAWLAAISFQGLDISKLLYAQFLLLSAALIAFYRLPVAPLKFPLNGLTIVLALFWLWIVIAPNWSLSPDTSRQNAWVMGLLPAAFFICQLSAIEEKHWTYFLYAITVTGCLLALHAIYQVSFTEQRASSIFLNPNSFAALLNLITLAGIALLFINFLQGVSRKRLALIILGIFIMAYAIGLTQSRGAVISLFLALTVLFFSSRASVPVKFSLAVLALVALAILMSDLHASSGIVDRLQALNDPYSAGASRFYIWESSWEMIKATPWLGVGAGMFWLVYPQYRSPLDLSAGFYVHNDYLQVWIENGLPALILLCMLLITVLVYYLRSIKIVTDHRRRIELAGIFSGLLAISFHSLFTFNFYILSILVLGGIFLARFNHLYAHGSTRFITINFSGKTFFFHALITIIFIFIASLLAREGLSEHYRKQALALIANNNYVIADQILRKAEVIRSSERIYLTRTHMLIKLLQQTPLHATATRQVLFDTALAALDKSTALNPHRSFLYLLKGRLYAENPQLGGDNGFQQAENLLLKSLQLNPNQYRARYALALHYANNNLSHEASKVLNAGLEQPFMKTGTNIVPYLQLALRLNHEAGNIDAVNKIAHLAMEQMPKRENPYTIDEIINNVVNSNTSSYNFNVYDDENESLIKM